MKFADFLNENAELNEAKKHINAKFAAALLLLVGYGSDRLAWGLKNDFYESIKVSSDILKSRAAKLAGVRKPNLGSIVMFGSLVNSILGKELYVDGKDVIINDKKAFTIKNGESWKDVIESVPGLKAKLKAFREEVKDKIVGNGLKI